MQSVVISTGLNMLGIYSYYTELELLFVIFVNRVNYISLNLGVLFKTLGSFS